MYLPVELSQPPVLPLEGLLISLIGLKVQVRVIFYNTYYFE